MFTNLSKNPRESRTINAAGAQSQRVQGLSLGTLNPGLHHHLLETRLPGIPSPDLRLRLLQMPGETLNHDLPLLPGTLNLDLHLHLLKMPGGTFNHDLHLHPPKIRVPETPNHDLHLHQPQITMPASLLPEPLLIRPLFNLVSRRTFPRVTARATAPKTSRVPARRLAPWPPRPATCRSPA